MSPEKQGNYAGWRRVWIVVKKRRSGGFPMRFNGGSSYFSTSGGGEIFFERADAVFVMEDENRTSKELGYEPDAIVMPLLLPPLVAPSPFVRAMRIALEEMGRWN